MEGMIALPQLRLLRLAKDAMDRDWSSPIDLATVAAHAGYSRYHFVRLFRAAYGETPGQYLSRRRIERAQELLRSANLTVTEICMLVGFTSLGTFSTRFKQVTGVTPTAFRAKARQDGPAPIPGCFVLFWAGGFAPPAAPPGSIKGLPVDQGRTVVVRSPIHDHMPLIDAEVLDRRASR